MNDTENARVIVDLSGKAGLYQHQKLPGWEVLGTVTQGDATGALVRNLNTGLYAMANAGAIRSVDQRLVRNALKSDDA